MSSMARQLWSLRNLYYSFKGFRQINSYCEIEACHLPPFVRVSEEVREAVAKGKPMISLESTVVTHGLPYPQNIRTALSMENEVRQNGCVPVTIGLLSGKVILGMSSIELEIIGDGRSSHKVSKVSSRDLPHVISKGLSGGTTVAATAFLSQLLGIRIFATGGIGGVHRNGESTLDVSSDLIILGRTPITVVSAGVKSILDIERTLEYLETQGVCISVWGTSLDFPAFLSTRSGHVVSSCVANAKEAADLIEVRDRLKLQSGILLAVPLEGAQWEEAADRIQEATHQALREARECNVRGKEVTPFVLQRLHQISGGLSLEANSALLLNNARVASLVALELWRRKNTNNSRLVATSPRRGCGQKNPPVGAFLTVDNNIA